MSILKLGTVLVRKVSNSATASALDSPEFKLFEPIASANSGCSEERNTINSSKSNSEAVALPQKKRKTSKTNNLLIIPIIGLEETSRKFILIAPLNVQP